LKVLFDTSVLIAAIVEPHSMHERAFPWLKRARDKEFELIVASHTLAELYSVLTTLPIYPRIPPGTAWRLVHENVESIAKKISLSPTDYSRTIKWAAERGLTGGIIYDALIAQAAKIAKVDQLLTLDLDDFKRAWPDGASRLKTP
jgi:predicted nucleic acid-binding protein